MAAKLNKRKREILTALGELGEGTTTRQIAEKLNLSTNGISQSLTVLAEAEHVKSLGGKAGGIRWTLLKKE